MSDGSNLLDGSKRMTMPIQVYTQESLKGRSPFSVISEFLGDLRETFKYGAYSVLSAYYEIKSRYAVSKLGPLWLVLTNMIFIGLIGASYSSAFGVDTSEYVPFLATGYLIWTMMVAFFLQASEDFQTRVAHIMRDNKVSPLLSYVRVFFRALIIFAHNVPFMFMVIFYYKGFVVDVPMLILGFTLFLANCFFLGLICIMLSSRFRDIYYAMPSIFQILILMMPILWMPNMITGRKTVLLEINLLYQLLEIVRAPLLGMAVPTHYFVNCSVLLVISFVTCAYFYTYAKNRLVLWL